MIYFIGTCISSPCQKGKSLQCDLSDLCPHIVSKTRLHTHSQEGAELTCDYLLQFAGLIFAEFVALMVVASPLVQVQAQVTTSCLCLSAV